MPETLVLIPQQRLRKKKTYFMTLFLLVLENVPGAFDKNVYSNCMDSFHLSAKSTSMALLNSLSPIKNIKETMNYLEFCFSLFS